MATEHRWKGAGEIVTIPLAMTQAAEPNLYDRVNRVIMLIRPAMQSDGGDVELVEVTGEGVVKIRFHGACCGCPSSKLTLQSGIERNLRERVPQVQRVEAVA